MSSNSNLHKAKNEKNNEFYTQLADVARELIHYKEHFKGKVVFCNCNDSIESAFWQYFHLNFAELGLKRLISTSYSQTEPAYEMIYSGGDDENIEAGNKITLKGNGDFRSQECIEILKEADIICTNPPFSLFREYIAQLMEYGKKFIIIGNQNASTYKEIFPLIKDAKLWWGVSDCIRWFVIPDWMNIRYKLNDHGERTAEGARSRWWTNLDHNKRHKKLVVQKHYTSEEYSKYDGYNAINVNKTIDIPCDYDGIIGVPITFLDNYNPEQFEIIGLDRYAVPKEFLVGGRLAINGKSCYARILIRRKGSRD